MQTYFGTVLDIKNIALAKLIFDLRQDIDLHILFTANWAEIEDVFGVSGFFPQIRRQVLGGVVLGICKMYEIEGRKYQLNSIDGILKCLKEEGAQPLDQLSIATFVASYCDANGESAVSTLDRCVETVRGKYKSELEQFRTARDKVIAHSEFFALVEAVPSLDIMEQLFGFGADFYEAICESFVGTAPDDLRRNQPAMQDCIRLLEGIGIKEVKKSLPLT